MNALGIHNLTAVAVVFIAGYVIPFATSLISQAHWSGATKGAITTVLSAAAGFFGEWASSPDIEHWDWRAGLFLAVGAFLTAHAARSVVLRATTFDDKLLALFSKTAAPAPAASTSA